MIIRDHVFITIRRELHVCKVLLSALLSTNVVSVRNAHVTVELTVKLNLNVKLNLKLCVTLKEN